MLEIFEFEGKQVRFVGTFEKPEWVAKDVCSCLGLSNVSEAMKGLEDTDLGEIIIPDNTGRMQKYITIFESGLYTLIFKSRKEEAKKFKRWTFEEVLPSIRKTGSYSINKPTELSRKDILLMALEAEEEKLRLKAEYDKACAEIEEKNRILHLNKASLNAKEVFIQRQNEILTEQNQVIEESQPKVEFYQAFREVETNVTAEIFAKTVSNKLGGRFPVIGRNNLFKILRKYDFVRPVKHNPPYQRYVNSGLFTVIQKINPNFNQAYTQTLITPKGQQELLNWFLKKYQNPEDLRRDLK